MQCADGSIRMQLPVSQHSILVYYCYITGLEYAHALLALLVQHLLLLFLSIVLMLCAVSSFTNDPGTALCIRVVDLLQSRFMFVYAQSTSTCNMVHSCLLGAACSL